MRSLQSRCGWSVPFLKPWRWRALSPLSLRWAPVPVVNFYNATSGRTFSNVFPRLCAVVMRADPLLSQAILSFSFRSALSSLSLAAALVF